MLYPVRALVVVAAAVGPVAAQPSSTEPSPDDPANAPGVTPPAHGEHVWTPDNETIDPSQLPVERPAPPSPYPRVVVARPLFLPAGRAEGSASFGLGTGPIGDRTLTYATMGVSGRIAAGPFEPYLGAQFVPFHSDGDVVEMPVIQRLLVGTRLRLARGTALGVEGGVTGPGWEQREGYWSNMFVRQRIRASERIAIELAGGGGYTRYEFTNGSGSTSTSSWVSASAGATAQLQVAPLMALEASGSVGVSSGLHQIDRTDRYLYSYGYGGGPVFSIGERVDLVARLNVYVNNEIDDEVVGGLAFVVR